MAEKNIAPKEIADKIFSMISIAKDTGRIRKGTNEATKSIESGKCLLTVIAANVDPEEIVMHLPILCDEKGVPFVYVERKEDLGKSAGLSVSCAAIGVESAGSAKESLEDVISRLGVKKKEVKEAKREEVPAEAPKEKKPRKKKEEKKE